jgi:hypothetical protein
MYENLGQKNTFTVAVWCGHPLIFLSYERKSYQLPVLFGEEFFAVANVWFNKVSWKKRLLSDVELGKYSTPLRVDYNSIRILLQKNILM